MFAEIFKLKNTWDVLSEMNAHAVDYYNRVMANGTTDITELRYFLLCLDRLYREGFESPLRDNEYDDIHEYYIDKSDGDIIRGEQSVPEGDKIVHVYPNLKGTIRKVHFITEEERLASNKVKSQKSFESWIKRVIEELKYVGIYDGTLDIGLYTKFDGLSVILEVVDGKCVSAITRGDVDTGEGQNKTKALGEIDLSDDCKDLGTSTFGLKCEAVVSKKAFPDYNRRFGDNKLIDERSAATSILNTNTPSPGQLKYLTLVPLMLSIDGVDIPFPNYKIHAFEWANNLHITHFLHFENQGYKEMCKSIRAMIDIMSREISEQSDLPVDGIVMRIENQAYKDYLGRDEDRCVNNWERAYKFPPARAKTMLLDVVQDIGLLGKVSFIAKVKPVKLKNKTIKSISLGSYDRFVSLRLTPGDEVYVQYDIIPYLTVEADCKKSGNPIINPITECPYCGETLTFDPEYSCVNPECPSRVAGRIYNYCEKMGMDGIGPATIETLFSMGVVKTIPDLYNITSGYLHKECGFGPVESMNIVSAITAITEVDAPVLLGALGISGISRKTFEKVLDKIKYKDLIEMKSNHKNIKVLTNIPGIKTKTATKILDGISMYYDEIHKLMDYLKVNQTKSKDRVSICFTNIRDKDFEKHLISMGFDISDNVTKNTYCLITGGGKSSKTDKATKYNVPILTLQDAYTKFGYRE